jgi:hypothetical protein
MLDVDAGSTKYLSVLVTPQMAWFEGRMAWLKCAQNVTVHSRDSCELRRCESNNVQIVRRQVPAGLRRGI